MTERRFPPPWSVEELDACFIVKDSAGQKLAFVYYEEEPGRRSAAKLLTCTPLYVACKWSIRSPPESVADAAGHGEARQGTTGWVVATSCC
jgi:hypothetical protein